MTVTIIAAVARDRAIGIGGDMPFHISTDLRRFKALTMGHPLVMGRRTFDSLPGGALPGRRNIVITRQSDWSAPDAETAHSLDEALATCDDGDEVMIIGGGEIYASALPRVTRLLLTEIDASVPEADTYFPDLDLTGWQETEVSPYTTDPRSGISYRFRELRRDA